MSAKQLPKPVTGIKEVDRHLALVADTLNPVLRTVAQAGMRQLLNPFTVVVPTDWVGLALLNSFTALNGAYAPRIRKNAAGDQAITEGAVIMPAGPPASFTAIATVPATYAPDQRLTSGNRQSQILPVTQNDAHYDVRVDGNAGVIEMGSVIGVPGDFVSLFLQWTPADRTPIVPSCFPVDVPHSLPSSPIDVRIASCVDQSNVSGTPAFPPIVPQWKLTPGVPNSIRILNIPGLLPLHTYAIQLLASA